MGVLNVDALLMTSRGAPTGYQLRHKTADEAALFSATQAAEVK